MELFRKYEHLQIEDVCRICLTKKDQMSLIYETGLADMLLECASIQVSLSTDSFYTFLQELCVTGYSGKWIVSFSM